tara:strand:- start:401 stop:1123 length:723 start_codon:yes stop_codon:yes gene_type:complete
MISSLRIKLGYLCQNDIPVFITKFLYGKLINEGPFKGMQYINKASCSAIAPKILGTYEIEIQPIIQELIKSESYQQIVNIGAADGYYAVGLATQKKNCPIIAYEASHKARELLQQLSEVNHVSETLSIKGICDKKSLDGKIKPNTFFLIDIEGFESELFEDKLVSQLADSTLLIETHTFQGESTQKLLSRKFQKTHQISLISRQKRPVKSFPSKRFISRYLQNEHRRDPNNAWIFLTPKQ